MSQRVEYVKATMDWSAVVTGLGVFAQIIPPIVGVFTLAWLGMQMWTWIVNKKWKRQ